jgi:hypothetical protein
MSNPARGASSRPLPGRPSLELERKHAKALLRQLRAGDPDALARARSAVGTLRRSTASTFQLADAQLIVAREYGFLSWPRLVQYFGDVSRQRPPRSLNGLTRDFYEHEASQSCRFWCRRTQLSRAQGPLSLSLLRMILSTPLRARPYANQSPRRTRAPAG